MSTMRWHTPKKGARDHPARPVGRRRVSASVGFNESPVDPAGWQETPRVDDQDWESNLGQFEHEGPFSASERIGLRPGVIAPGWRLLKTFMLRIERDEDGSFVVSDEIFALHGDGTTRDDAIRDYVQTLIEYHDLLAERAVGDGPTAALLRLLNRHLEKEGN